MAEEIIDEYGDQLESITLIKSEGGRFEVDIDGRTVFSKMATKRHAHPGEVVANIGQMASYNGQSEQANPAYQ